MGGKVKGFLKRVHVNIESCLGRKRPTRRRRASTCLPLADQMMNVRYMASPAFAKASAFIKITADKTAGSRVMVLVKG